MYEPMAHDEYWAAWMKCCDDNAPYLEAKNKEVDEKLRRHTERMKKPWMLYTNGILAEEEAKARWDRLEVKPDVNFLRHRSEIMIHKEPRPARDAYVGATTRHIAVFLPMAYEYWAVLE